MTTLSWPVLTIAPKSVQWRLVGATQVHVSPLTGAVDTQELPGAYWSCILDYSHARGRDADKLWSFASQMRGRAGRVNVPAFHKPRPSGAGGGTPLVNGAGQLGSSLIVDGGPLSTAGWLLEGDFVGVAPYLYMLTADAATNGSGQATLALSPPLRRAPADNAPVVLVRPTAKMMFIADEQGSSYAGGFGGGVVPWVFTLREDLRWTGS